MALSILADMQSVESVNGVGSRVGGRVVGNNEREGLEVLCIGEKVGGSVVDGGRGESVKGVALRVGGPVMVDNDRDGLKVL